MPNPNDFMDADDLAELRSIVEELARHAKTKHVVPVRSPIFGDLLRLFAEFDRQVQRAEQAEAAANAPPLFSVREAMREAGVPDWEMGKGVSSVDAIRLLTKQRDEARREIVHLDHVHWHCANNPISLHEHAERLYPGEGERLFPLLDDGTRRT